MSNLVTLTRIYTSMNQCQLSYTGRKLLKRTSTVSSVTTNEKKFTVFSLSGRNARYGNPVRTLVIESIHGREKGRFPFSSTGVGKWYNHNFRCEVLLTNDLRSLDPQSPAGTGLGKGPGIRNRV